jgi:DNA repair exonuclease SbcCD ATPase subunit
LERGGQDNVTVQVVRYGARKDAQAAKQAIPENPVPKPTSTPPHTQAQREAPSRGVLAVIIIAVVIVVFFLVAYYFTTLKTAELDATREITSKLQKELETTSASLEKATKRVEEMQGQLATEGRNAKSNIGKLQKDLQEARASRDKAAKQVEELTKQLATEKQSVKAATAKLQKEVQEANASKEKALTEAKGLRQKLDSKERELQQAKKQLERLTTADQAPPAQQETTPTKGSSGTPPATGAR